MYLTSLRKQGLNWFMYVSLPLILSLFLFLLCFSLNLDISSFSPTKMSSVISTTADELLHSQLYETLKKMVANAASELKKSATDHERPSEEELQAAVPISVLPPDADCPKIIQMLEEINKIRQPRVATISVGEMSIAFEVPSIFPVHRIDVEKLVPPGRETTGTSTGGVRKFSFYERLKGWKIEVRQRQNWAVDSYFHHEKLKAALRSVTEVVGFMMYEDPNAVRSHKRKAASLLKEESSNKSAEAGGDETRRN